MIGSIWLNLGHIAEELQPCFGVSSPLCCVGIPTDGPSPNRGTQLSTGHLSPTASASVLPPGTGP